MFVNSSLSGMHFGFPDVCLSPPPPPLGPVPIPYPNMATLPMGLGFAVKNFVGMMPSHNMATTIPTTLGDFGGVLGGGVMSASIMGPARNIMGSVKLFTEGMPATKMLSPAIQNSTNVPCGMSLVPSQFKVMALT